MTMKVKLCVFAVVLFFFLPEAHASTVSVYIDTPNICTTLQRVDEDKVYLVSGDLNCMPVPGRLEVKVEDKYSSFYVYVDGNFWKEQQKSVTGKPFNTDDIKALNDRVKDVPGQYKLPENVFKDLGQDEAKKANDLINSEEFQQKVAAEKERLEREVFGIPPEGEAGADTTAAYYPDSQALNSGKTSVKAKLPGSERLYLFISSSIPVETVRSYIADIARVHDANIEVFMRGFVGGMTSIKPTARYVSSLILKDKDCDIKSDKCATNKVSVQIDPLLFRRYGIEQVPALVYARGVKRLMPGSEGIENHMKVSDYYVMYGDASLAYLLKEIRDATGSPALTRMIDALSQPQNAPGFSEAPDKDQK